MKFIHKPTTIEATRFPVEFPEEATPEYRRAFGDLANWCGGVCNEIDAEGNFSPSIDIITLEGTMTASPGDWIIQGVKGEFYPCKPDVFEESYTAVVPAHSS